MEKVSLYIKRLNANGDDTLFPDSEEPARLGVYTYNAQRMGGAPNISATLMYKRCLDGDWTHNEYVEFRGEKYYVTQIPTSSKSGGDVFYKHELILQSERAILDNTLFFDVVTDDINEQYKDRYRSNDSKVTFSGDINELAARLTSSMIYSGLCTYNKTTKTYNGYHVVVDDGITSEVKEVSFDNKYLSEALQEIFSTYELTYYFVGKTCHIGYTENAIITPFEYGIDSGLISIIKTNANNKLIDRITGKGSSDNLPYYYPNEERAGIAEFTTENVNQANVSVDTSKILTYNASGLYVDTFTLCKDANTPIAEVSGELPFYAGGNIWQPLRKVVTLEEYVAALRVHDNNSWKPISFSEKRYYFCIGLMIHGQQGSRISLSDLGLKASILDRRSEKDNSTAQCNLVENERYIGIKEWDNDDYYKTFRYPEPVEDIYENGEKVEFASLGTNITNAGVYDFAITGDYLIIICQNFTVRTDGLKDGDREYCKLEYSLKGSLNYEFKHFGNFFVYGDNKIIDYKSSGITISNVSEIPGANCTYEFYKDRWYSTLDTSGASYNAAAKIKITGISKITPMGALMPTIYRETGGAERFYNAENNKYNADTYLPDNSPLSEKIAFKNPYIKGKQHEAIQDFNDIKPTIEGVENAEGKLFGEIADIAFDENDNDLLGTGEANNTFNGTDEYVHSYFYIRLNVFNGDYGFNIFDYALENAEAQIEMTSGNCAACKFKIGVLKAGTSDGKGYQFYNPVLVDDNGYIVDGDFEQKVARDISGCIDSQQNTNTHSVWIAVKKETDTFGVVMPNATNNYRPSIGDKFVITGISMPNIYITAAEKRLDAALIKYMKENNEEHFTFSVNFSRIYLAKNDDIANILNENARLIIKYNGIDHILYVSNYTVKADDKILYEINVDLAEELTIGQNSIKQQINAAKSDIISMLNSRNTLDVLALGLKYFIRKDTDDFANGIISFLKGILFGTSGKYGITGEGAATLKSLLVDMIEAGDIRTDYLTVTKAAHFFKLVIDELKSIGGQMIVTAANCRIDKVAAIDGGWRLWWRATDGEGKAKDNQWAVGDQAITWAFNLTEGTTDNASNRYWWRLVTAAGSEVTEIDGEEHDCHYIDVSSVTADKGSMAPETGDTVAQLGNRTDPKRQGAIIIAAYNTPDKGIISPSIAQYKSITDFDLASARYTWFAANGNKITGDIELTSGEDIASYTHFAYSLKLTDVTDNDWVKGDGQGLSWRYMGVCSTHNASDEDLVFGDYSWNEIEAEDAVTVTITTDKGNIIKNGQGDVTLTATVYKGGEELGGLTASQFSWTRTSGDASGDAAWNTTHKGYGRSVLVTASDIRQKALFECEVEIDREDLTRST